MAKGKKTGGKDFQIGHGIGRPRVPDDVRKLRTLNSNEFCRVANEALHLTLDELDVKMIDPNTSVFELSIFKLLRVGIDTGDVGRLNFFLDRLIGKPKITVDQDPKYDFTGLPREELIKMGEEAIAYLKAAD